MNLYYFTFGQKYRHEPHPQGGHPDGWFTIEAPTEDEAANRMFKLCGQQWAGQYVTEPKTRDYPRGELRRILWQETIPEPPKEFRTEIGVRTFISHFFPGALSLEHELTRHMADFGFPERVKFTSVLPVILTTTGKRPDADQMKAICEIVRAGFANENGFAKIEYWKEIP